MEFKPTPLFGDCIKEHTFGNLLITPSMISYLDGLIKEKNYAPILEGIKLIHDNKDFYYLDPNNISMSRTSSALFILINFLSLNPIKSNDLNTIEDIRVIMNNAHVENVYLKDSYDISYDPKKIMLCLTPYLALVPTIKNLFFFSVPTSSPKKIKIAWL